jgi:acyl carrier protein
MRSSATTTSLFDTLTDVVRDVFDSPDLVVTRETTAFDIDGWDSLSHTILLLRVESTFGVCVPLERSRYLANIGQLADLVESLTREETRAAADKDMPYVIFHGSCQMGSAATLLEPILASHYRLIAVRCYLHPSVVSHPEPAQIERCAVFIQEVSHNRPDNVRAYASNLPRACRRLRVPFLAMRSLWPFFALDPRNVRTEAYPFGKYPYGDSYVMQLMKDTTDPEAVFRRYMETDLRRLVDLDRHHEEARRKARANDRLADIPLASTLEENFRALRLFDTVDHTSHALQMLLRDILAEFILEGAGPLPDVPAPQPYVQMPIHPQVIDHFQLTWATAQPRNWYFGEHLTFEDWLKAYIAFE